MAQLFSGTLVPFVVFVFVVASLKMVFPKKGSLFLRVTEQLRWRFCWHPTLSAGGLFGDVKRHLSDFEVSFLRGREFF